MESNIIAFPASWSFFCHLHVGEVQIMADLFTIIFVFGVYISGIVHKVAAFIPLHQVRLTGFNLFCVLKPENEGWLSRINVR